MKVLNNRIIPFLVIILSALFLFQACGDSPTRNRVEFTPPAPFDTSQPDSSYTTDDGLKVIIVEEGYGPFEVIPRDQISVYYTGRIIENGQIGKVFESSYKNGNEIPGVFRNLTPEPITSPSGQQISPLIDGLRRGILGMKKGEKRVIIIPPSLGYEGSRQGTNGYNLRNDTLRYDVELNQIL